MVEGLGVLGGLKIAQARNLEKQKVAQSAQEIQNQRDYQQSMVQDAKDRLAELTKQHDTENKHVALVFQAAQNLQKIMQLKDQQDMVEKSNATGVPIPGAAVQTPMAAKFQPGMIGVTQPTQSGTQTLSGAGPNGEDLVLPFDPQAYAQHQQDIQELLKGPGSPEAKARIADYQAQYGLMGQNQKDLAQFQNQLPPSATTVATLASEEKRAKDQRDAQRYDANLEASSKIRAAQISQGLDGGDQVESAAAPYIKQVHDGQLSMEGLNALKLPKAIHNTVIAGVAQDGGVIPNQAELGAVAKYAPVAPLIGAIDQYNALLKNSPVQSRIPGTDDYKKRQALEAQIETQTPGIARSIGTETGRLSNQQIEMSQGLVQPGTNFLSSNVASNQQKRDTLLQLANSAVDANLSRLPAAQAASIKAKTGLTAIPYGGPQQVQPQPGNQQPGQPQHLYFDANGKLVNQ